MSSHARRYAAAALCAIALPWVPPAAAQSFADRLTVRVYDFAALDIPVRSTAVAEASAIVADAGASAGWHDCTRAETCVPEAGELSVRIVRETGTVPLEWKRPLGYAVVDPVAGTGTLATIYINRVEDSARHAGTDVAVLLGRAIAHEVGHLILHTNEHAEQGLMRAVWTEQEMSRNAHEDWVFASSERRQIRAALQRTSRSALNRP